MSIVTRRRDQRDGAEREPAPRVEFDFEDDETEAPVLDHRVPAISPAFQASPASAHSFNATDAINVTAASAATSGLATPAAPTTPTAATTPRGAHGPAEVRSINSSGHASVLAAPEGPARIGSPARIGGPKPAESAALVEFTEDDAPLETTAQHSLSDRWAATSRRHKAALFAGVGVLVIALASGAAVEQAQADARDKISVQVTSGSFTPSPDGAGLDLALTIRNDGPANATLLGVQVYQPGLSLFLPPLPMQMTNGRSLGVILDGRYACKGAASPTATTVTVGVRSPRGVVTTFVLPLPRGAVLPAGWQAARAGFCAAGFG